MSHLKSLSSALALLALLAACGETEAPQDDAPAADPSVQEAASAPAPADDDSAAPDPAYVWDLTELYPTAEAWEAERNRLAAKIAELPAHQSNFGADAASMAAALADMSGVLKEVSRLYVYASLKKDEDQRISEDQERFGRVRLLYNDYGSAVAWLDPAILALGEETVRGFIEEEPALAPFDFYLEDVLRNAPHTLSEEGEALLASAGVVLSSPSQIYQTFANADIPWPTITLSTGEEAMLNQSGYTRYRGSPSRDDRKAVFDAFWSTWEEYKDGIGATLNTEVNANVFIAKARNYPDVLTMQLAQEAIPSDVYRTLVNEVNESLPTLHRYFELRGRMLGVEDLGYHDIYPPLVNLDKKFSLETSRDITVAALEPFGEDYLTKLQEGVSSRWAHVYPQPGKRSGAYMSGSAYDVHPYVLLNHNDDYNSMSTYAHEWGHAVHTMFTTEAQPYEKADYSIFIAEIAAIIAEILVEEHMIANAETDEEKLFYLGQSLESMRGTFYRQTMFAEFELAIHEAVEAGEALTGERMNEIYLDLLKRYHGHDKGVMTIDDLYAAEWAYIPHFYYDFYVYQYSTSLAGAAWFANRLASGEEGAQESFIELLKAGGSDHPYQLLLNAGLDMASPDPYRATAARMNSIMDQIEALLDKEAVE